MLQTLKTRSLFKKNLNLGVLKPSLFAFTNSWGDVTRSVSIKYILGSYFCGIFLFIIGAMSWNLQNEITPGYAKIYYKNFTFYISSKKLLISVNGSPPNESAALSTEDCSVGLKLAAADSAYSLACQKFLNDTESFKWWVADEISKNNKTKNTFELISYAYLIMSILWTFSFTQFLMANSSVKKIKPCENIPPS